VISRAPVDALAAIKRWPAKQAGGNPRGELPIIVPWHAKARAKLRELLRKTILKR